jgi:hypothetical protein
MDTQILHIAFERMLATVQWDKHGENEYIMVGDGPVLRIKALQEIINKTFKCEHLWVSLNRHVGYQVPVAEAAEHAAKLIAPMVHVFFSDETVTQFLEIHPYGVARTGKSSANPPFN